MSENESNKLRPQVRVEPEDSAWIDAEVRKREAIVGRRKVWGAHVVHDLILFYSAHRSSEGDEKIKQGAHLMDLPSPNASAHQLIDELIAARPETAKNMLATIRALLKEERVEATVVPAQAKPKAKGRAQAGQQ